MARGTYRVFRKIREDERIDDFKREDLYLLAGEHEAQDGKEAVRIAFDHNGLVQEGDTVFAVTERNSREHRPKTKTILVWE